MLRNILETTIALVVAECQSIERAPLANQERNFKLDPLSDSAKQVKFGTSAIKYFVLVLVYQVPIPTVR